MPPLATASVPANVIVPEVVIGPPLVVRPVVPPLTATLVTVAAATQLVTPVPSVDSTLVLLPAETGSVRVHAAEADALDCSVVDLPAIARLARTREPAVTACAPSVSAPPLILARVFPETAVPVAA